MVWIDTIAMNEGALLFKTVGQFIIFEHGQAFVPPYCTGFWLFFGVIF